MAVIPLKIGIAISNLRLPLPKHSLPPHDLGADAVEIDARSDLSRPSFRRPACGNFAKCSTTRGCESRRCRTSRRGYNAAEQIDKRVPGTKEAMKLAYRFGAGVVVNQIGLVPTSAEGADWNLLVEVLSDLGRFGQHNGASWPPDRHRVGADLANCGRVAEGSIGVDLDPGSLLVNGFRRSRRSKLGLAGSTRPRDRRCRDLARGRGLEVALGTAVPIFRVCWSNWKSRAIEAISLSCAAPRIIRSTNSPRRYNICGNL